MCPTCSFGVGESKRYCARCGSAVPRDAPLADYDSPPAQVSSDERFAALGRATMLATAETRTPLRADLLRSVAEHEAPRCADCGGRPAVSIALRRSRRQTAFVAVLVAAVVALRALRWIDRDPSLIVGWVFAVAGAVLLTLPLMPWWRCRTVHMVVCRECGLAQTRALLDRAARSGALLPVSLLWNGPAIATDYQALRKLTAVASPRERRGRGLDAGRSLLQRSGIYLLALSFVALFAFARSDAPITLARAAGIEAAGPWEVGGCVSVEGAVGKPVDCQFAHDGHVLEIVRRPDDCPVHTVAAVEHAGRYYCVDDSTGP
jgi:hypothetical protein